MKKFGFYLAILAIITCSMSLGVAICEEKMYQALIMLLFVVSNVWCIWLNRNYWTEWSKTKKRECILCSLFYIVQSQHINKAEIAKSFYSSLWHYFFRCLIRGREWTLVGMTEEIVQMDSNADLGHNCSSSNYCLRRCLRGFGAIAKVAIIASGAACADLGHNCQSSNYCLRRCLHARRTGHTLMFSVVTICSRPRLRRAKALLVTSRGDPWYSGCVQPS